MKTISKIQRWATTTPDRIAYYSNRAVSYGELWSGAKRLATALTHFSANSVVLFGDKEPELLMGMIGCLLAGKTYVPITNSIPTERFQLILRALGTYIVLTGNIACPSPGGIPISTLISQASEEIDVPINTNLPAYIIFTSGSTGTPKGVPISRNNLDNFTSWISQLEALRLSVPSRVLNQASFSFDLSIADIFYSLCNGHTLYGMPSGLPGTPDAFILFLQENFIQAIVCTPTFLKLCLIDQSFSERQLPDLRVIYSCGEILENATAYKLLKRFRNLRLLNAYGPSEATSAVCAAEITREMAASDQSLPVGIPDRAACKIEIQDGEIVLKGDSVFSGYLDGSCGGYFCENGVPCFRTGDLGEIIGNYLYFRGREDRQIKWKGYRIELDEIEQAIQSFPVIANCAVIAKKTDKGIVRLIKAFIVPSANFSLNPMIESLKEKLPAYMIPKSFVLLDQLPLTESGKINRRKLEDHC